MQKRIYLLITTLFIINITVFAQWSNILTNNKIYASCFATSADTCYASGSNGEIFRTTNGGLSWDSVQTIFTTSWFNDIYFPSSNVGYACGGTAFGMHQSIIAKTTNGGQTWDSLSSNAFGYEFNKVFCVNDSVAYFGGDDFVKTTDGGQTFSILTIPTTPFYGRVTAIYFFNDTTGLIAINEYINANRRIYRIAGTTNGGLTWTTTYIDSSDNINIPGNKNINEIYFRSPLEGFAVADLGIYLTSSNGGTSWTSSHLFNDSTHLKDIVMSKTSGTGFIASWKYDNIAGAFIASILITEDTGQSWQQNFTYPIDGFHSLSMADDDTVYAAGYGNVFKTNNGGVNFIRQTAYNENPYILFPNPAVDKLRITNHDKKIVKIKISNMIGQTTYISNEINSTEIIIDVSNWNPGIYLAKINAAKNQFTQKFIVNIK